MMSNAKRDSREADANARKSRRRLTLSLARSKNVKRTTARTVLRFLKRYSNMAITKKTATATAYTAHGKKLDTPITFDYTWSVYGSSDDVKAADKWPNDRKIAKMVTAMEKGSARSAGQAEAFEAAGIVKPTAANDTQVALKDMFRTLMLQTKADGTPKFTVDEARKRASLALDIEWADDDEDDE